MKRVQEKKYKVNNSRNMKMILLKITKLIEAESTRMIVRRWGEREIELSKGYKVGIMQHEYILESCSKAGG